MTTRHALVLALILATLAGCQGTTTTEIRREPARVRFLEIDTRPVPAANLPESPDSCPPLYRVLAMAAIATDPPKPIPITVDPSGKVTLPPDFNGVLRLGDAEGEKPGTRTPDGGGSWSTALTFVSNTTRVPTKGAGILMVGALFIAAGAAAWWFRAGVRIAGALAIFGAVLVVVGYMIQNAPWVIWLAGAGGVAVLGYWIYETRKGHDATAAIETTAPVVEDLPRIITDKLTELMPDASGTTIRKAAAEAAATVKGAIGGKAKARNAKARVDRAVDRAKKATSTETAFRGV